MHSKRRATSHALSVDLSSQSVYLTSPHSYHTNTYKADVLHNGEELPLSTLSGQRSCMSLQMQHTAVLLAAAAAHTGSTITF